MDCSVEKFEKGSDKSQENIIDYPRCGAYIGWSIKQPGLEETTIWLQAELWEIDPQKPLSGTYQLNYIRLHW